MGKDKATTPDHHHSHKQKHDVPETKDINDEHLDFSKKHPVFNVELEKKGPEWSDTTERQFDFVEKYAGRYVLEPPVPKDIPGLVPRKGPLPSTRRWWRPSTSFERNGNFNLHTRTLNTRVAVPGFIFFVLYGWYGHSILGRHYELYHDNGEWNEMVYDKLNTRVPPQSKIWLRPA